MPICLVVRVEDRKAAEVYESNDRLGFLEQLSAPTSFVDDVPWQERERLLDAW